jgi:Fe-S-cluster containining protein
VQDGARSERERSDLCLSCGLCCQGALHDLVPLDEDELARAQKLRLPVVESPLRLAFRLPCPRLDERRCTVYAERPRTCASYACDVLRAYGAGEVDEATARQRIEQVRSASAEVAQRTGEAGYDGGSRPQTPGRAEAAARLAWMRRSWFDP